VASLEQPQENDYNLKIPLVVMRENYVEKIIEDNLPTEEKGMKDFKLA